MVIKITIVMWLIYVVWGLLLNAYLDSNLSEKAKISFTDYKPNYIVIYGLYLLLCLAMSIISVIYLLFVIM